MISGNFNEVLSTIAEQTPGTEAYAKVQQEKQAKREQREREQAARHEEWRERRSSGFDAYGRPNRFGRRAMRRELRDLDY